MAISKVIKAKAKKKKAKKTKAKKKAKPRRAPVVAGWREWVSLPDLGVAGLKAKLDTGARSSALHALSMRRFTRDDGAAMISFKVHPVQRNAKVTVDVVAELVDERDVKDSGGKVERRPVVRTNIELGGERWPIEVTLSRRDEMGFRMLLGRQALKRRYLVDSGGSFLLSQNPAGSTPRPARKKAVEE